MFEQDQDINKEKKAVELYLRRLGGSYKKLGQDDVDFRIQGENGAVIGYAEVKVLDTEMKDSFPLMVEARKIIKLRDKRLHAVMIWSCIDGIYYLPIEGLVGRALWSEEEELMLSFDNKKLFKYVRP
jgi:hypothetical protein|tara:strand:- start:23932 stop:24312 length:381 start_codon:yes stop_codon:yes gene_type:complete